MPDGAGGGDVVLNQEEVSRAHCGFSCAAHVTFLGALNGTTAWVVCPSLSFGIQANALELALN